MIRSIRSSLRTSAILLVVLGGCAKGGTTLDADSAENPAAVSNSETNAGSGGSDSSDSGGSGGAMQVPCGNGTIDMGEDCDGTDVGGVTCVNLGFDGGNLTCDPMTCVFETSMCTRDIQNNAGMGGS